jgi:hypothetical protein
LRSGAAIALDEREWWQMRVAVLMPPLSQTLGRNQNADAKKRVGDGAAACGRLGWRSVDALDELATEVAEREDRLDADS